MSRSIGADDLSRSACQSWPDAREAPMSEPDTTHRGLRDWLRDTWLPLLVVIVGYVGVTVVALRPYDFNPSGPIRIGTMLPAERFWRSDTRVEPGVGYDGQWFFYIAH